MKTQHYTAQYLQIQHKQLKATLGNTAKRSQWASQKGFTTVETAIDEGTTLHN